MIMGNRLVDGEAQRTEMRLGQQATMAVDEDVRGQKIKDILMLSITHLRPARVRLLLPTLTYLMQEIVQWRGRSACGCVEIVRLGWPPDPTVTIDLLACEEHQ